MSLRATPGPGQPRVLRICPVVGTGSAPPVSYPPASRSSHPSRGGAPHSCAMTALACRPDRPSRRRGRGSLRRTWASCSRRSARTRCTRTANACAPLVTPGGLTLVKPPPTMIRVSTWTRVRTPVVEVRSERGRHRPNERGLQAARNCADRRSNLGHDCPVRTDVRARKATARRD